MGLSFSTSVVLLMNHMRINKSRVQEQEQEQSPDITIERIHLQEQTSSVERPRESPINSCPLITDLNII